MSRTVSLALSLTALLASFLSLLATYSALLAPTVGAPGTVTISHGPAIGCVGPEELRQQRALRRFDTR